MTGMNIDVENYHYYPLEVAGLTFLIHRCAVRSSAIRSPSSDDPLPWEAT